MKNQDDLLYAVRRSASAVRELFESVDTEIEKERDAALDDDDADYLEQNEIDDEELEADDVAPHLKSPIGKQGDVNQLYAEYIAAKSAVDGSLPSQLAVEGTKNILLADVTNYALRLFASESFQGSLNGVVGEDLAQDATVKVLQNLDEFRGQSKFSTWVFRIIKNAVADAVRKEEIKAESPLNDEIIHAEKRTDVDAITTGSAKIKNDPSIAFEGTNDNDDDGGGESSGGQPVYSPSVLHAESDGRITDITLQDSVRRLSPRDQHICKLLAEGYKTDEIAAELRLSKKQTYNSVARLRETLKHELCVLEVVVHTCRLSANPAEPNQTIIGYVAENEYFRAVSLTCRCRKGVTRKEARQMLETGEAQEVHHTKNGELVLDEGRIWAAQAARVPRVGLSATTQNGIEAALDGNHQVQRDIEIAHEITLAERAKLIIYEEDLIARGVNPHEWDGRAVMVNYNATRQQNATSLGKDVDRWTRLPIKEQAPVPSQRQPEKPHVTETEQRCPKCKRRKMITSIYRDGSIHHECRRNSCAYLQIFKNLAWSVSKTEVSSVIVVNPPILLGETSAVSAALSI